MASNRRVDQDEIDDLIVRYGRCRVAGEQDQVLSSLVELLRRKKGLGHRLPDDEQQFLDMVAEEQAGSGYHRVVAVLVGVHYLAWVWFVWLRDSEPVQTSRAAGAGVGMGMLPHGDALIGPWMVLAGVSVVLGLSAIPVCRPPLPIGLAWFVAISIVPVAVVMGVGLALALGWHALMS